MFAGMRGRQIDGRFISLTTSAFGYATEAEKQTGPTWSPPLGPRCACTATSPAPCCAKPAYLHQRTGGMIGGLDQLIHEAANEAISDGTEKIARKRWTPSTSTPPPRSGTGRPPRRPVTAAARKTGT